MTDVKRAEKELEKGDAPPEQSIPFSRWPMAKWKEWNDDCNKSFNGCRWFKAYSDHLKSKNVNNESELYKKIAELEARINALSEQPEKEEGERNLAGELIK